MDRMGAVRFGQIVKRINLALVPEAKLGDYVLVHAGIAISRIQETEAQLVFSYLETVGELEALTPGGE